MKMNERIVHKFSTGNSVIGRKLDGDSLRKWTLTNELQISETSKVSVESYFNRNTGFYSLTWSERKGCRLNFYSIDKALTTKRRVDLQRLGDTFMVHVSFGEDSPVQQKVRIDAVEEATRIPKAYYKRIKKILDKRHRKKNALGLTRIYSYLWRVIKKFAVRAAKIKPDESHTGIPSTGENLPQQPHDFFLTMTYGSKKLLQLHPSLYYDKDCNFLIKESDDDTWVLGSSILRAISVSIVTWTNSVDLYFDLKEPQQIGETSSSQAKSSA